MPNLWEPMKEWFNSSAGRRVAKAVLVVGGGLVSSGMIPLDMPVAFGFSLGQILIGVGVLTPTGEMNKALIDRLR